MFFVLRKRRRVRRAPSKQSQDAYTKHKTFARAQILSRLNYWNMHYKQEIKRVAIRNTRSRWGSCSELGNLNFNYKLALLPLELMDYVIVHELCHLKEFSHSPQFWNHVAETIPQHRVLRKQLRKEGMQLQAGF